MPSRTSKPKRIEVTGESARRALRPTRVWHPLLLALCPVLGLFAHNAGKIPAHTLVRPAAAFLGSAIVLWMVLRFVMRDRLRGGLVASLMLFAFSIVWGVLEDAIQIVVPWLGDWPPWVFYAAYVLGIGGGIGVVLHHNRKHGRPVRPTAAWLAIVAAVWFLVAAFLLSPALGRRAAWIIAGYGILFVASLVWLLRYRGNLDAATRNLNAFAGILVCLYLAVFILNARTAPVPAPPSLPAEQTAVTAPPDSWPDIYLIVLQGYGRSDMLAKYLGYNAMPFEQRMRELGFAFATASSTNYADDLETLAACLNMDYLDALAPSLDGQTADPRAAAKLYHQNRLFGFFNEHGYQIMAFSPGIQIFEPRPPVDEILKPHRAMTESEAVLLGRTALARVLQICYYLRHQNPAYWQFELRRARVLYTFETLAAIAEEKAGTPRFVLANMLIPSPPFLFTRTGGRAQPFGAGSLGIDQSFRGDPREFVQSYLDQVYFVERSIEETVEAILTRSSRPALILVISASGIEPGQPLDTTDDPARVPFATLLAVRYPPDTPARGPDAELYDSISLVNLFRVTLNRTYGTQLPLLPDRLIVPAGQGH